jgi:hypothetical protein
MQQQQQRQSVFSERVNPTLGVSPAPAMFMCRCALASSAKESIRILQQVQRADVSTDSSAVAIAYEIIQAPGLSTCNACRTFSTMVLLSATACVKQ